MTIVGTISASTCVGRSLSDREVVVRVEFACSWVEFVHDLLVVLTTRGAAFLICGLRHRRMGQRVVRIRCHRRGALLNGIQRQKALRQQFVPGLHFGAPDILRFEDAQPVGGGACLHMGNQRVSDPVPFGKPGGGSPWLAGFAADPRPTLEPHHRQRHEAILRGVDARARRDRHWRC